MFSHNPLEYKYVARLQGHIDAIQALSINKERTILASGGSDGVRLWNMVTLKGLPTPLSSVYVRGPVTCLGWIQGSAREILCYGTARGWIVCCGETPSGRYEDFWSRKIHNGQEITSMAICETAGRVVVGTRDQIVQVFTLDTTNVLQPFFHRKFDITVPSSLAFRDNSTHDIYVFGLYNGQWHILSGEENKILDNKDTYKVIGRAAIAPKHNQFVVDNGGEGFDVHDLNTGDYVRNLSTGLPLWRYPKQVCYGEDYDRIIAGSDHGKVYVFETQTGHPLQTLKHQTGGLVQTVMAFEKADEHIIVCASSSNHDSISISVWSRKKTPHKSHRVAGSNTSSVWDTSVKVIIMLSLIILIVQNYLTNGWIKYVPPNGSPLRRRFATLAESAATNWKLANSRVGEKNILPATKESAKGDPQAKTTGKKASKREPRVIYL